MIDVFVYLKCQKGRRKVSVGPPSGEYDSLRFIVSNGSTWKDVKMGFHIWLM